MCTYETMEEIETFLKNDIVTSDENVISLYDLEKIISKEIEKFNLKEVYAFENKMKDNFREYSFLYCFYKEQVSSLMLGMGHTDLDFRTIIISKGNENLLPSVILDDWNYSEEKLINYKNFFVENMLLLSDILVSLSSCGNFFESSIDYNQLESMSDIKIGILKNIVFNLSFENILKPEGYSSIFYNGVSISTVDHYTESKNIKNYILGHKEDLLLRKGIEIKRLPLTYQKVLRK